MAKGNLFLGTAKKTIGDIVLYRRNGVQQSRVRVRHIANPKTEAQALQRNYMAPVTKFYAPLAGVLERSWEGLNRSESLSAFLKENVTLARQNGWYVVKGAEFTPLPYKVSKGILAPLEYTNAKLSLSSTPSDLKVSTISAILVSMGYEYGDQVTFIACLRDESKGDIRPIWARFLLSESDTADIFADINGQVSFQAAEDSLEIAGVAEDMIACAFIMSRWDGSKWLRSTQFVKCDAAYLNQFTSPEARAAAIASYQGGASVVSSDVYLNGGSGSKSSDSSIVCKYVVYPSLNQIGLATPVDVVGFLQYSVANISFKDAANGAEIEAPIIRIDPSDGTYKGLLRRTSGTSATFSSVPLSFSNAVVYYGKNVSVDLWKWLYSHGLRLNI